MPEIALFLATSHILTFTRGNFSNFKFLIKIITNATLIYEKIPLTLCINTYIEYTNMYFGFKMLFVYFSVVYIVYDAIQNTYKMDLQPSVKL